MLCLKRGLLIDEDGREKLDEEGKQRVYSILELSVSDSSSTS